MRTRTWLIWGAAAGAAMALLWRERRRGLAQARQVSHLTQEALARLCVPAEWRFYRVGDVRLHTIVAGPEDGPLALLLHGFPECWYSWRHQIPVLAEAGYRVVVPDQRGYNLSDKPKGLSHYQIDHLTADLLGLVHKMGRERAVILGHDWGGVVAWRLAMDYPEAVERLVVMNGPHPVAMAKALRSDWSQRRKSWYMFFFQVPWLPETVLTFSPMTTARLLLRGTAVRKGAFSHADLEVMAAAIAQPGAMRCMIDWYRAAFRTRAARKVRPAEAPTLLIWGEDDVALGKALTYGMERWAPDLEVQYIAECGHWVQSEASQEVNERLMGFLKK